MLIPIDGEVLVESLSNTDLPHSTLSMTILSLTRRLVEGGTTRVYLDAEEYLEIEQYL